MKTNELQITAPVLYILLTLAIKDRHGYEIMKEVEASSGGKVTLGPGTLYGSIKRLLLAGYIKESKLKPDANDDSRRIYYHLTKKGRQMLGGELTRLSRIIEVARNESILGTEMRLGYL
jgi:DNA-binding PadR family transcriptional regulator